MSCPQPMLDPCVTADTRAWGQPAVLLPSWAGSPCSHPPVETGKGTAHRDQSGCCPRAFLPYFSNCAYTLDPKLIGRQPLHPLIVAQESTQQCQLDCLLCLTPWGLRSQFKGWAVNTVLLQSCTVFCSCCSL